MSSKSAKRRRNKEQGFKPYSETTYEPREKYKWEKFMETHFNASIFHFFYGDGNYKDFCIKCVNDKFAKELYLQRKEMFFEMYPNWRER